MTSTRIAERVVTGLFALLMTVSGVLYLVGPARVVDGLRELGYPLYFLKMLGTAKLLGVMALYAPGRPKLREWAYAGFSFDLIAAVVSHLATNGASHLPPALFALSLLVASYLLRRRAEQEVHSPAWLLRPSRSR